MDSTTRTAGKRRDDIAQVVTDRAGIAGGLQSPILLLRAEGRMRVFVFGLDDAKGPSSAALRHLLPKEKGERTDFAILLAGIAGNA